MDDPVRRELAERLQKSRDRLLRQNREIDRLTARVVAAQEGERRRLSQELHDNITQRLIAIVMRLRKVQSDFDSSNPHEIQKSIAYILERLDSLAGEIQNLSRRLYPVILERLGLKCALESECESFSRLTGIRVEFRGENCPASIPPAVALCVYRIVQECLSNAARHGSAARATVEMCGFADHLSVCIRDTGVGFDPSNVSSQGLGLESMRERARHIEGKLVIHSARGAGTVIELTVPLPLQTP